MVLDQHIAETMQDFYAEFDKLDEPDTSDKDSSLFHLVSATFDIPVDRIDRITSGMSSYIEGFSVVMGDVHLVMVNATDPENVNDAIAPNSITFTGRKFVAFLDQPEVGGSVFLGDIPDMVSGSLIAGSFGAVVERISELTKRYIDA